MSKKEPSREYCRIIAWPQLLWSWSLQFDEWACLWTKRFSWGLTAGRWANRRATKFQPFITRNLHFKESKIFKEAKTSRTWPVPIQIEISLGATATPAFVGIASCQVGSTVRVRGTLQFAIYVTKFEYFAWIFSRVEPTKYLNWGRIQMFDICLRNWSFEKGDNSKMLMNYWTI